LLNNSILASDKMIPQNTDTASPTAGSKFKSSLAHALQKKDFPKHVNLPDKTTGTIPENQLLEPNAGGASTVKGTSAPSTGEAARNSFSSGHAHGIPSAPGEKRGSAPTVNMSLLKALNKFKVQGNQIKKRRTLLFMSSC
jgi:hypothetical protein